MRFFFCELSSSSAVSEVGDSLWSPGRQRLPAAAPGANSRGQQWRRSLQDHIYSSYQHNALIGNHISTIYFFLWNVHFLKIFPLLFSYLCRSFLAGSSCSTSTITYKSVYFSVVFHCALREHDLNYKIKNVNLWNLDSSQIKDIFSFVFFFFLIESLSKDYEGYGLALMVNSMSLYYFVRI